MSGDGHANETRELNLDAILARAVGATDRPYSHLSGATAEQRSANAVFITGARDDVLALVAEVRRLREREAQLLETCESAARDIRFLLDPSTLGEVSS